MMLMATLREELIYSPTSGSSGSIKASNAVTSTIATATIAAKDDDKWAYVVGHERFDGLGKPQGGWRSPIGSNSWAKLSK